MIFDLVQADANDLLGIIASMRLIVRANPRHEHGRRRLTTIVATGIGKDAQQRQRRRQLNSHFFLQLALDGGFRIFRELHEPAHRGQLSRVAAPHQPNVLVVVAGRHDQVDREVGRAKAVLVLVVAPAGSAVFPWRGPAVPCLLVDLVGRRCHCQLVGAVAVAAASVVIQIACHKRNQDQRKNDVQSHRQRVMVRIHGRSPWPGGIAQVRQHESFGWASKRQKYG
mmetsp:Transcript_5796/g.17248  ORF Transcript_5796/g.17248 Transcript_5796/m.17248 type:complete len:225 (-) Transcript_5796:3-677(-)